MNIHFYEEVDSTNNIARNHLTHASVIIAEEQTGGKGRYGNVWASPKGNLYMSLVWQVPSFEVAGQYAFITALALATAIESLTKEIVSFKWPNDILLNGKKLSGVLLETEQKDGEIYLIIGIGVNIASSPDYAINLNNNITPTDMSEAFIKSFKRLVETFESNGFQLIRKDWLAKATGIEQKITVRLSNKEIYGIFKGIDETGALLLEEQNGWIKQITSGEVFFT